MNVDSAALDSRKAWIIASVALATLTISYGALLSLVQRQRGLGPRTAMG